MTEHGVVIKSDDKGIEVQMFHGQSCEGCSACFIDKNRRHILHLQTDLSIQPGEQVEVEINPAFAITSALLIFFLPALMIIAGYYFFQFVKPIPGLGDPYNGVIGALLGIVLTYGGVHFYDKKIQNKASARKIRILRVVR